MAEVLTVPEEDLAEVISIIRAGLKSKRKRSVAGKELAKWCDEEEAYLKQLSEPD